MGKREDRFVWGLDVGAKAKKSDKKSAWERIAKGGDDDDDLPGPNAGATLWPSLPTHRALALA